jgi:lysophospholipase L1-like esterase
VKTAVIIGDSHVEPTSPFAQALAAKLQSQGYTVTIAGVGSSNAYMWARQQTVCRPGRCVDQSELPHRPALLVISLGTNDAANAAAGGRAVTTVPGEIKRIVAAYAPKEWLWIGPPATRDNVQYYTNAGIAKFYAAANAAGVSIFDSRAATRTAVAAGSGDGVHLGPQGAQSWANAVANAIASQWSTAAKVVVGLAAVTGIVLLLRWKRVI